MSGEESAPRVAVVSTTEFHGGAELYIQRLSERLRDRGISVDLVGSMPAWDSAIPVPLGASRKWGLRSLLSGLLSIRSELARVRPVAASERFDIAHLHFKREQVGYTRTLAKHVPVVWTEHGLFPRGLFGLLIRPFYRRASRRVESIICVSEMVADDIRRIAHPSSRIVTIPSGIDLETFRPLHRDELDAALASLGVRRGSPIAAVVGRLESSKRPGLAIEAATRAGCTVLVAGDGRLRAVLEARFTRDPVIFMGHTDSARLVFGVAQVHVFASNGKGEGFPTVLLESAAVGVPTVGTHDCGFSSSIESAGGVVSPADLESLTAAITTTATSCEERSMRALRWSKAFGLESMVDAYLTEFNLAISQYKARPRQR